MGVGNVAGPATSLRCRLPRGPHSPSQSVHVLPSRSFSLTDGGVVMGPRALLVMAMTLSVAAFPRIALAQEPTGVRDALQLLDAWVGVTAAQRQQPGLSIGVVLGDRLVWAKGYG
jgi:hypothetical protein